MEDVGKRLLMELALLKLWASEVLRLLGVCLEIF